MSDTIPTYHGFVDLPGVRLAYDRAGQGDAVIFLHGGLLDRRMWDDQFSYFARHYQAIRYDMRSAGRSETTLSAERYTHHEEFRLRRSCRRWCNERVWSWVIRSSSL
jgi:pimeloyl-ACP methyl ester carboxylesterase